MNPRRASSRAGRSAAIAAAAVVCLASCSSGSPEGAAPVALPNSGFTAPVPSVVDTPSGTWVSLPMGHLDDPLDTFWQLLYRPAGATSWSDQVQATATATNGGLDLAAGAGSELIVGVRPTARLVFSPLIATDDGGKSWHNGLLPTGLAAVTDAIAAGTSVPLALVDSRSSTEVLAAGTDLSDWHPLTTEATLAATPAGRACGLTAVTAVASEASTPVIGGVCSHPGAPAAFALTSGVWQADGPAATTAGAAAAVLELEGRDGGLTGLFATTSGRAVTGITAGWTEGIGKPWHTSPSLRLGVGQHLTSFGPAGDVGRYVLVSSRDGSETLEVLAGPGAAWQSLPSPPLGTQAVVISGNQPIEALTVDSASLTVWSLSSVSGHWVKGQVLNVSIDYGSSS